jgi:glycosyltransferase involved in cell wall biosynthesis
MIVISVLIPTFRRTHSFLRAARSVFAQAGVTGFELIAVDNSPEGAALCAFQELSNEAQVPFRWAHEPRPGVAQARNAALALAQGRYIAWLDDDEEAPPHWLAALLAARTQTGAQSVFGPVRAKAHDGARNARFFEQLYARPGSRRDDKRAHGIGNSMQPRLMFGETPPFDARHDTRGGEDDALFASWAQAGARFAWAQDAWVTEHIGPERTRLAHGLKRAFAYGQGPCEAAWRDRRLVTLARHMCVGIAQTLLFGVAGAVAAPVARAKALNLLGHAARGAGKVFWLLEQHFYGDTLVHQDA